MKFLRRRFVTLLLIASCSTLPVVAAPATNSPDVVVQGLYHSSLEHFSGFTTDSVKLAKPWVTPLLYKHLLKKASEPQSKGAAPAIEGDIFLDSQEPPTQFVVGKPSIQQTQAKVDIALIWPGEKRHYTVMLEQVNGAWKVSDVHYGKDGNLTDLL